MAYEDYQALDPEQKMLARFRSLEAVLQAARAEHTDYDLSEGTDAEADGQGARAVVTSAKDGESVTVQVERRFSHPVLLKTQRRSRKVRAFRETREAEEAKAVALQPGDKVIIQRDDTRPD